MKILFIHLMFFILACEVCAEDRTVLYESFYAGMSSEEFFKTGPAQCDEYPEGKMICNRQKIPFAGMEWTQFFEFKNNGLTCVAFGSRLAMNAIDHAMAWLQEEKYIPINAETGDGSLDFTALYDKNSEHEFEQNARNFNRNLLSANRFNAYLIKRTILDEYQTTDRMPGNAILVTLGGIKSQGTVFVCFEPAKNFRLHPFK